MNRPVVYILQSLKNGRYYIGSTIDLDRRFEEHSSGFVKATKNIRPLKIVASIVCNNPSESRKSEYRLKQYKSRKIIENVIRDKMFPWQFKGL